MGDNIATVVAACHSINVDPSDTPRPSEVRVFVSTLGVLTVVLRDEDYEPYSQAEYEAAEVVYEAALVVALGDYTTQMEAVLDDITAIFPDNNTDQYIFQAVQLHQPFVPPITVADFDFEDDTGTWLIVLGATSDVLDDVRAALPDAIP